MNEWLEQGKRYFDQDASKISNWIVTLEGTEKRSLFSLNSNSKHRAETDFEDRPNTCERVPRVPSRFNYERNRSEQRSSTPLPLLSSIVPHSDRHKVSSFVFVAESCEPNPSPARPLTTRMTDDERRRLIHIDSDIWIADTRILRHGTRFKPSSTRLPPSPARFERVRFVGAQKQGEETNGIERFLHIARLDGLPRAKPSFERHSSSLEEREWRKGEGSSLREYRQGREEAVEKNRKVGASFRLAFARPRLRADVGFNRLSASCASR